MSRNRLHYHIWGLILILSAGCENLIEYSPYQSGSGDLPQKLNEKVISGLKSKSSDTFEPFRVAIIGDSHTYYDDFDDQIKALNSIDSIDFVIHNGDITMSGIYREFMWYQDIASGLSHPMIAIVGNHDFLSNGELVYQDMFGPLSFSFDYNNCRFVFFDDIIWERNVEDPDFEWLYSALEADGNISHVFLVAHIPPWSAPFSVGNSYLFYRILEEQQVSLSIHGHTHSFFQGKRDECEVPFLISGDATDREIILMDVRPDTVLITRESF
ncbi:metallophosphoesterase [Marinilabilia salmonicolor]|uniref:Calcineurin-like phosphoesterase family protein n=1 Tax=Marinilabilia salmonicolor TaxID=989 RepID=A0A2T0XS66_9BACT|nr:metallophosphoesterase [Marinilabilia salmonicolor]PRZ01767.1 calcineurin-like phosphoesterase family protein [Marinilabilia salmonicolor]RCW31342.1 calcineurin-like phosphoesterase family protein [Marinilabilia salmonicolor]